MPEDPGEITVLLRCRRVGDKDAESRLFELLSPELRKIAGYCFRRARANHTLQPTAILNEAFLGSQQSRTSNGRTVATSSLSQPASCVAC